MDLEKQRGQGILAFSKVVLIFIHDNRSFLRRKTISSNSMIDQKGAVIYHNLT